MMKCENCKKYWPNELYITKNSQRLCYDCASEEVVKEKKNLVVKSVLDKLEIICECGEILNITNIEYKNSPHKIYVQECRICSDTNYDSGRQDGEDFSE